ncbi:membrane protein insertion efficiency factor YidD [Paenibacillus doosanensis]|uniref:Putative membrane protein insertion efficiency factor n=1 Tax=Paenibacillus konkukensis TaxID=2020716 RepID=A0ABY4RW90_9BACL|nr:MULTISPECIES: membrane protein insertion efficiency factor YidD [Paenibacillus]MCS7458551.1 membrane protein insertion efficiency factor YidD [Paenibacillus doosanensis]UQZ86926.1 Putative membrane protein insertion efficiency factor [Paenibacillus konkukensis]
MKRVLQGGVRFYRKFISPLKPPTCRFYPTCSQYALDALELHGPVKGSWLAVKRICKCHPFHPGGIDYVPEPERKPEKPRNDAAQEE